MKLRPLAALLMLLACVGWAYAQEPSSSGSQGQNPQSQSGQQAQPGQAQPGQAQPGQAQPGQAQPGQEQPGQGQPGAMPGQEQNPQAQPAAPSGGQPSGTPSGQAGAQHRMPSTGSPLGLLVLLGLGAIGAGSVIKWRLSRSET